MWAHLAIALSAVCDDQLNLLQLRNSVQDRTSVVLPIGTVQKVVWKGKQLGLTISKNLKESPYLKPGQEVDVRQNCDDDEVLWGPVTVKVVTNSPFKPKNTVLVVTSIAPPKTIKQKVERKQLCARQQNVQMRLLMQPSPKWRAVDPDVTVAGGLPQGGIICCGDVDPTDSNPAEDCKGGGENVCAYWWDDISGLDKRTKASFPTAKGHCEGAGYRLCSRAEIEDGTFDGTDLDKYSSDGPPPPKAWVEDIPDVCGNGRVTPPEECDDGNSDDDDGCSSACQEEYGWRCKRSGTGSRCTESNPILEDVFKQLDSAKDANAALTRALIAQQVHMDELVRKNGDSGVYATRGYADNFRPADYLRASYYGNRRGPCGVHNHADHKWTVGMADCAVVLNGVHFRTRHNDYHISSAGDSTKYGERKAVPFPGVPPDVTGSVANQVKVMKEYFEAWGRQDHTWKGRDYREYFYPVLCYLEGWLEYGKGQGEIEKKTDAKFKSQRHELEAKTWDALMEVMRTKLAGGTKSNLENLAYMPQEVVGIDDDGQPIMANLQYELLCHPLKDPDDPSKPMDLPFSRFRPVDNLSPLVKEENAIHARTTLFEVDPMCSEHFDRNKPWQRIAGRKGCKKTFMSFVDEMMAKIPGKDNYAGNIVEEMMESPTEVVRDGKKVYEPLNLGYYNRNYRYPKKDANNRQVHARGFHDNNLWVAQNTQEQVAGYTHKDVTRRFSYALPFEVVYMTPLWEWNPHKIDHVDKHGKKKSEPDAEKAETRRTGCLKPDGSPQVDFSDAQAVKDCAWTGTTDGKFFRTPAELFDSSAEPEQDAADTSNGERMVLDHKGVPRRVVASGARITLAPINGKMLRQRWPIFPLHESGTTVWKELKALQALLRRKAPLDDATDAARMKDLGEHFVPLSLLQQRGDPSVAGLTLSSDDRQMLRRDGSLEKQHGAHTILLVQDNDGHEFPPAEIEVAECDGKPGPCVEREEGSVVSLQQQLDAQREALAKAQAQLDALRE